jgi:7,8-dihydro-6-hydroxymethylpterin-pyrophosphokinase
VLAALHGLEARAGRDRAREGRWGARTLDLDLLVWSDRTVATARLVVPHPRLAERSFALAPLVDLLGPAAVAPGLPAPLGALLAKAGPPLVVTDYGFAPGAPPAA